MPDTNEASRSWWQDPKVLLVVVALATGNLDKLPLLGLPSLVPETKTEKETQRSTAALWREIGVNREHNAELREVLWEIRLLLAQHGIMVPVVGPEPEDGGE